MLLWTCDARLALGDFAQRADSRTYDWPLENEEQLESRPCFLQHLPVSSTMRSVSDDHVQQASSIEAEWPLKAGELLQRSSANHRHGIMMPSPLPPGQDHGVLTSDILKVHSKPLSVKQKLLKCQYCFLARFLAL